MPSSSSARSTRTAISPRLATSTLLNMGRGMVAEPQRSGARPCHALEWAAWRRLRRVLPPRPARGRRDRLAKLAARADDHPRAHRVVARLVDEDERAGGAVVGVGVGGERLRQAQTHAADVVELELAVAVGL